MASTLTQRLPQPVSLIVWIAVIALGTFALAGIALNRGESIDAMWFIVAAVCVYALGYRFYSAFLAAKVFALDPTRATPAERFSDGRDFVPTNRWVVFGHHFAIRFGNHSVVEGGRAGVSGTAEEVFAVLNQNLLIASRRRIVGTVDRTT
jgi:hypothetical protein